MNKTATISIALLIGCAAGAAMPRSTAQSFPSNPTATRWEQFCERVRERDLSEKVRSKGNAGWRLVSHSVGQQSGLVHFVCFQRPIE